MCLTSDDDDGRMAREKETNREIIMDKFYTQTYYCNDGEITVDRMVIVCCTPEEAAQKALDNFTRKGYNADLEDLDLTFENDLFEDDLHVPPGVLVTTGGYGDFVDGEQVEREYLKYFPLEDITL